MKTKIFNSLYWKISGIFLVFTVLLTLLFIYISGRFSTEYNQEAQQKINGKIAQGALELVSPIFIDGKVNEVAMKDLMHSMMVAHPSIEVYLLNPTGKILTYVVPGIEVKTDYVSLEPIKQFLSNTTEKTIKGDDPRNAEIPKVFSAAEIIEEGEMKGYLYIILASNEYASTMAAFENSFILKLGLFNSDT